MVSKWKEDGSFSLMVYGGCAVIFAGASFVTIRMLRYIGDSDSSIRARRKMLRDRRIRKSREKTRSIEARRRRRTSRKSRWKASQSEDTETKMPKIADEIAATLESIAKKKVEMVSIGTQTLVVHDEDDICSSSKDVLIGSRIASKLPEDLTLTKLFNGMGMGAYVRVFQSHDIDIDALMLLEQPQLKELGLAIGPRALDRVEDPVLPSQPLPIPQSHQKIESSRAFQHHHESSGYKENWIASQAYMI